MKKINILLFLTVLFFGLNSCSDDDKDTTDADAKNTLVKFQSTINSLSSVPNGDSLWVKNTMIGVYGLHTTSAEVLDGASNLRYFSPKGKSEFGPANMYNDILRFPENGEAVDLIAYRPYNQSVKDGKLNVDLSKQNKPNDIDLLYSNNVKGLKQEKEAVADFTHVLSKIVFRIHLGESMYSIVGMDIQLENFKQKGVFDILDGTLAEGAVGTIGAKMTFTSGVSYGEAIVFPGKDANRSVSLRFGRNTASIPLPANMEIKANKQYVFDLTVNKKSFVLSEQAIEEDWLTNSGAEIILDPKNTANGEPETPFLVYQAKSQIGKKEAWVAGIVSDFKFPDAKGVAGTDYIVLKDIAEDSDSTKFLLVDIKNSPVADRLATSIIPDLVGKRVSLKGNIVTSTANKLGVQVQNVVEELGGGPVSGPVTELLFMETFGAPAAGEKDRTPLMGYEGYDMKVPVVYNVLSMNDIEFRQVDKFLDYGYHLWMPVGGALDLSIENIESKDYYDMKLMYDMANGVVTATHDILTIKCNGVAIKMPTNKVKKKDAFETVSVKIPTGTTRIEIIKVAESAETGGGHIRVDNIRIEGTIVK